MDQLQPVASSDWIELPPDSQEARASASWHIGLELLGGVVLSIRLNYAFSRITSVGLAGPQTMLAIILRSKGMDKMDFDSLGRRLREKGFIAVNVNETETPRGIAASWDVFFGPHLVARCHDSKDGACVCLLGRSIPLRIVGRGRQRGQSI